LINHLIGPAAFNPAESCQSILKANAIICRVLRRAQKPIGALVLLPIFYLCLSLSLILVARCGVAGVG